MPEPKVDANAVESSNTKVEETEESAASEETVVEEKSEEATEESLASESGEDTRFDKNPRFQQLIKGNKDKDARIAELEDLVNTGTEEGLEEETDRTQQRTPTQPQQPPAQSGDFKSGVVDKFVKLGYEKQAIEHMFDMMSDIAGNRATATEGRLTEFEIGARSDAFRARHKDFTREQELKMHKLWKSHSPEMRKLIARAPDGFDYLYDKIQGKNPNLPGKKVGSSNLGKTKTPPGSGGKKTYTRKELKEMSDEDYEKNQKDIALAEVEGRVTG